MWWWKGAPSFVYKDTIFLGYVIFRERKGITASIQTSIFQRLDHLQLFVEDGVNGMNPFLLLDKHSSRFKLNFLDYTNNSEHKLKVMDPITS